MIIEISTFVSLFVCCCGQESDEFIQSSENETIVSEVLEDARLRVPELVRKYEYPLEEHVVKTADDYILTMHRIPHGKNNINMRKEVVLLMHGLVCSSADWVLMGPGHGLAYLLADLGYDVWMGNVRGNTYSRNHSYFDPDKDKQKFWNFSWHEIGVYDLPVMIDTILNETNQKNLYYIGHSQGTTIFFVLTSVLPEYNDKIRFMIALGPIAFTKHTPNNGLRLLAPYNKMMEWVSSMMGLYEFLPSTDFLKMLGQDICEDESSIQEVCSNVLFLMSGYNTDQLNRTMLPVLFSNMPAGASTKQVIHYAQLAVSGKFTQFDYDVNNFVKYGQLTPPNYKLNQITVPVALIYGNSDLLSSEKDVNHLEKELLNPVIKYKVNYDKFTHADFLWAIDVIPLLYNKLFELLQQY